MPWITQPGYTWTTSVPACCSSSMQGRWDEVMPHGDHPTSISQLPTERASKPSGPRRSTLTSVSRELSHGCLRWSTFRALSSGGGSIFFIISASLSMLDDTVLSIRPTNEHSSPVQWLPRLPQEQDLCRHVARPRLGPITPGFFECDMRVTRSRNIPPRNWARAPNDRSIAFCPFTMATARPVLHRALRFRLHVQARNLSTVSHFLSESASVGPKKRTDRTATIIGLTMSPFLTGTRCRFSGNLAGSFLCQVRPGPRLLPGGLSPLQWRPQDCRHHIIRSVRCFRWCVLNSAQTFQRLINSILISLDFVFAFVDDVLIVSASLEY